jgi:hypothetical protein
MIVELNNRECVLVVKGNFAEANTVFELALTKHRQLTTALRSALSTTASPINTIKIGEEYMNNYDEPSSSNNANNIAQQCLLQRMTSISHLRTHVYCGQEHQEQQRHHEVYRLPIVMDKHE